MGQFGNGLIWKWVNLEMGQFGNDSIWKWVNLEMGQLGDLYCFYGNGFRLF